MTDLRQQLADLTARVQRLEEERAVQRVIVAYGLAVDCGDADRTAALFEDDALYDTDVRVMNGRAEVADMVRGERHQGMVGSCAHTIGPALVRIEGDRAVAVGYSRVYLRRADEVGVYRVSANHWELRRHGGSWRIARRTTRLLGHAEARAVLARGLDEQWPAL